MSAQQRAGRRAGARTGVPAAFRAVGITNRQIEHWVAMGWLRPRHAGGTGHFREWPPSEVAVGVTMKRLTDACFTAAVAARVARESQIIRETLGLGDDEPVPVELEDVAGGLVLTIGPAGVLSGQEAA